MNILIIVLLVVLSRLISPMYGFTPLIALSIFIPFIYTDYKKVLLVLISSLLLSDILLYFKVDYINQVFYKGWYFQYLSYFTIALISFNIKSKTLTKVLSAPLIFFIVSNLGVFLTSGMYPHNISGFVSCYINAIPFFKGYFLGTLFYSFLLYYLFNINILVKLKYKRNRS